MRRLVLLVRILAFAWVATAPLAAVAVPITYTTSGGSVTITAFAGLTQIANVTVGFSGSGSVTFDEAVPEITSISFSLAAIGPITLNAPYAGFDTVSVPVTSVTTAAGYVGTGVSLVLPGPPLDNYTYTIGPLKATGLFSASNSAGPPPAPIVNAPFNLILNTASGTLFVNTTTGFLQMLGVTIGVVSGNAALGIPDLTIKGDFTLSAAIPEPTTAALLGLGLLGLLAVGRRIRA